MLDADQFGCNNNFLEIDGQRMCGCKTNYVYETQWGLGPKIIRLRTSPGAHRNTQGFVFDIIQEQCPYRYTKQINKQQPIIEKSQKFLLSTHLFSNYGPSIPQNTREEHFDREEAASGSRFFIPQHQESGNVCYFSFLTLLQIKIDTLGVPKPGCYPFLQTATYY